MFFTPLPPGRTTLGHGPADVHIQGPGVAPSHCYIENRSGTITLHPCGNLCAVDGLQVTQPVRLSQGRRGPARITEGGSDLAASS